MMNAEEALFFSFLILIQVNSAHTDQLIIHKPLLLK